LGILYGIWSINPLKFVAKTRCQILRLKCTQFNFDWSSAPDPDGRAYSLLAGLKRPTCKGRERVGYRKVEGERGGQGRE